MDHERRDREREIGIQEQIATFNGWLVVVGAIQFIAMTFGLLYTARAANSAKKSADVSEQTLILTQRAFVCFREFRTLAIRPSDDAKVTHWRITMEWDNFGQTPAMRANCMIDTVITKKGDDPDFAFPPIEPGVVEGRAATLGPRTGGSSNAIHITVAQAERLAFGSDRLFICGAMEYNDIFGETAKHHTTVCAEVIVESGLFTGPNPFRYTTHTKYNHAD